MPNCRACADLHWIVNSDADITDWQSACVDDLVAQRWVFIRVEPNHVVCAVGKVFKLDVWVVTYDGAVCERYLRATPIAVQALILSRAPENSKIGGGAT